MTNLKNDITEKSQKKKSNYSKSNQKSFKKYKNKSKIPLNYYFNKKTKYIFVLGDVSSNIGKGVASASLGAVLKEMGYKVTIKKLEPYLNIYPGKLNTNEYGEIYVTSDGDEVSSDVGHYQRLAGVPVSKKSSTSIGKLICELLSLERADYFQGNKISYIPYLTNTIKRFIKEGDDYYEVIICEVGGNTNEHEVIPFIKVIQEMKAQLGDNIMICLLSYLFEYYNSEQIKLHPTRITWNHLLSLGITADILLYISKVSLSTNSLNEISSFTNLNISSMIPYFQRENTYEVPIDYIKLGLPSILSKKLNLVYRKTIIGDKWFKLRSKIQNLRYTLKLGLIIENYYSEDKYISLIESINHASWSCFTRVDIIYIDTSKNNKLSNKLHSVDCVIIPGGFGVHNLENMIEIIKICRLDKIPFLGICLGMQLAAIEFYRNVIGVPNASSKEFGHTNKIFIINQMKGFKKNNLKDNYHSEMRKPDDSLRIGDYSGVILKDSLAHKIYRCIKYKERHRHRYELNIKYHQVLKSRGLIISGISDNRKLPEIIEICQSSTNPDIETHPFFMGCQFHPEFNSSPFKPHPIFISLFKSSVKNKKN